MMKSAVRLRGLGGVVYSSAPYGGTIADSQNAVILGYDAALAEARRTRD